MRLYLQLNFRSSLGMSSRGSSMLRKVGAGAVPSAAAAPSATVCVICTHFEANETQLLMHADEKDGRSVSRVSSKCVLVHVVLLSASWRVYLQCTVRTRSQPPHRLGAA